MGGVKKNELMELDVYELRRLQQQRKNIEAELLNIRQQLAEGSKVRLISAYCSSQTDYLMQP